MLALTHFPKHNIEIYKMLQEFTSALAKCFGSKQWIPPNTNGFIVILLGWLY